MSMISQRIKSVIRVTTQKNQRKVRSGKTARKFVMVAEQFMFKGLSEAGINAIRLNVKDFIPQKFKGDRNQFKPGQMKSCYSIPQH
eukprot:5373263-Amphidinium_carterae.1